MTFAVVTTGFVVLAVLLILHLRETYPATGNRIEGKLLRAFDRQREKHPALDSLAGHRLDEPVAALRQLGFFAGNDQLGDRALAREIHLSIKHQLDQVELLDPLLDRPANWWAVARTSDETQLSTQFERDLLVAAEDLERVWWEPLEQIGPHNEGYVRALRRWSEISRGAFMPRNIRESWGDEWEPVLVSFELDGKAELFTHITGYNHQIDTEALRDFLNPLIAASGVQFEIVDLHHIPNIIVALRPEERRRLESERGWRFAEVPALVI